MLEVSDGVADGCSTKDGIALMIKNAAKFAMAYRRHPGQTSSGLTLIEVMVALAIFGVLAFFIVEVFNFGSLQKRESDEVVRQAEVAEYVAARIYAGEEQPHSGSYTATVLWPPGSGSETYAYRLAFASPVAPATVSTCAITVAVKGEAFASVDPDNYTLVVPVH